MLTLKNVLNILSERVWINNHLTEQWSSAAFSWVRRQKCNRIVSFVSSADSNSQSSSAFSNWRQEQGIYIFGRWAYSMCWFTHLSQYSPRKYTKLATIRTILLTVSCSIDDSISVLEPQEWQYRDDRSGWLIINFQCCLSLERSFLKEKEAMYFCKDSKSVLTYQVLRNSLEESQIHLGLWKCLSRDSETRSNWLASFAPNASLTGNCVTFQWCYSWK
jgi:hypothetical protein